MIVAGGETSGAIVQKLEIDLLRIGPEIQPGVPWTLTSPAGTRQIALALKSGNFGSEEFFVNASAPSRLVKNMKSEQKNFGIASWK